MFKQIITGTELDSQFANDFYTGIPIFEYHGDKSFAITMRMLLDDVPDTQVNGRIVSFARDVTSENVGERLKQLVDRLSIQSNSINIIDLCACDADSLLMNCVAEKYKGDGYKEEERVNLLFKKTFNIRCFVNRAINASVVIIDCLSMQRFHYIQCAMKGFLSWIDWGETSDFKKRVLYALRNPNADEYIACIRDFAEGKDFKRMRVKSMLTGIEDAAMEERMRSLENDLGGYTCRLNSLGEEIREILTLKDRATNELFGIRMRLESRSEDDPTILDYFMANKNIELVERDGSAITYICKGYLDMYNEDSAESILENHGSFLYDTSKFDKGYLYKVYRKIFLDREFKIRFCAAYKLDIRGEWRGIGGYNFDSSYNSYMPNPHIQKYGCTGSYRADANEALRMKDFEAVLNTSMASVQSLNWQDPSAVDFGNKFLTDQCTCIELPDGSVTNVSGAIKYIAEHEEVREEDE